jgi:threonine dehydratase
LATVGAKAELAKHSSAKRNPVCHNGTTQRTGKKRFHSERDLYRETGRMSLPTSTKAATFTPPDWQSIVEAHARIAPRVHRTPVLMSKSLDAMVGGRVFFKCENLQKTGSFKIRGATNAIYSLSDEEVSRGVVTQSSGNHGAAVACAAAWRGVPAWIVMPKNAPAVKRLAIEGYGGRVTLCEPTMTARNEASRRILAETGALMIHPYDDDRVIAGQATASKELLEEMGDLDAVFAPVSGGGLLSGTCLGAKGIRPGVPVFGCEPALADDAYRSLETGTLQTLDSSNTIADGLRASLSARTFAILREHVAGVLRVSEEEIISATRLIWERMKIIVEPSSAVAIAPLLRKDVIAGLRLPTRADGGKWKLGVIFSGGNVDLSALPF